MNYHKKDKSQRFKKVIEWFKNRNWTPFKYQYETWDAYHRGKSGLLNAPTGSGKTYAIWIPIVLDLIKKSESTIPSGLKVVWITPLRALAKDLQLALQLFIDEMGLDLSVEIRTGDTPTAQRAKQLKSPPTCLITTPESLHILFSQSDSIRFFRQVNAVVVDEWHELLSTKRGVQTELAIARIKNLTKHQLKIWEFRRQLGISRKHLRYYWATGMKIA